MRKRTPRVILGVFAVAALASSIARADGFVFVRSAQNPVPSLSKTDVRKLFTGQAKQWRSGKVFQGVIGEIDSPELVWLATAIFDTTPRDLITRIKQEIFRGEMKRPLLAKSSKECFEIVLKIDGALCLASETDARSLPQGVELLPLTD